MCAQVSHLRRSTKSSSGAWRNFIIVIIIRNVLDSNLLHAYTYYVKTINICHILYTSTYTYLEHSHNTKHVKLRPTYILYVISQPHEVRQLGAKVACAAPVRAGEPPAEVDEVVKPRLANYNMYHKAKRNKLRPTYIIMFIIILNMLKLNLRASTCLS